MGDLLAPLLAGLLGGVHCPGMCGGFAAACARRPRGLLAWHAGRVGTYVLLGAVAGAAGSLLPGPAWVPGVVATLLLGWFALAFAGLVPEPRLLPPGLARVASRALTSPKPWGQLAFGLANGLLPCGLVYSALAMAAATGAPWRGALAMLAFGLGTVPLLSAGAMVVQRLAMGGAWRRRAAALAILASGTWAIWARVHLVDPEGTRDFLRHCMTFFGG